MTREALGRCERRVSDNNGDGDGGGFGFFFQRNWDIRNRPRRARASGGQTYYRPVQRGWW